MKKQQGDMSESEWVGVLYVVVGVVAFAFLAVVLIANSQDQKEYPMINSLMKQNQTK